ncbi:DNA topoisomerase III [Burkholderia anthina]|uniref:DNA topoisomerase III n=1 Tax=Burkholderia anthina TaxID=179879 RepID=UPI001589F97C|nr:DNA topoisomerase III [Burkholderia anthina]
MSKALIIAEKPSVANDIARALGGFTKHDEYYESDEFVLSSAVGHLLEIAAPEEYEVKRGKWSFAHLPVIPPHFDLNPIAKSESRLKVLTKLMKRKDVDRLINACDAGREGELIFRLIAQHAKAKQPVQRLWLQSMTPQAIRDGFANLRSDTDMQPLADAARCRSEADWLVGINGTRAMTAFNSKGGGFFLTTVGRVQTPTLSIVVEREEKIRRFVPRDYWEVKAEFACAGGFYEGKWFDPKFKRDEFDPEKRDSRLWSLPAAETIVAACRDQVGTVSEESKPSTQLSPLLFDLTSLQREANSRFGFSAKNTLGLAQALYEKHKVLTYPRTDARALPEDYLSTVQSTLEMLKESHNYLPHAKQVLDKGWVKPNKRIFDNSKISDHFAIIPTLQAPKSLSEPEQKLYDMVVKRFLAVFFPAAEFRVTTRITEVAGHHFKTEGKVLVEPGWLQVYGRDAEGADANLVPVQKGEKVKTDEIAAVALVTKPPARYSEATLLSAMEGAGKLVEDDELREAMAAKGLGTPATRAAIIEGLLGEKYLVREGRELIPTAKAFQLMTLLRGLGVKELTAPELTGEWEYKLSQMERGNLGRDAFMQEIARMTQQIVKRAKEYDSDTIPGDYATLATPCPNCGGQVKENYRRFACTKCEFSISKIPGSRQFEIAEVEELLREKTIGPLSGFRSKMGRPFSAILKLSFDDETKNYKLEFDFGQDQGGEEGEAPDFSAQEPVGACPKCKGRVFEHGMSYVCEHSVANPKTCDFRSGKVILQQEIAREQMAKLLADGRTDLLPGFKSSRTGRNFKAFLVKQPDGKIGFEFEKKEPKAAAAKKTAKSATKDAETVTEDAEEKPAPARKTAARKTTARKTGS